MPIPTLIIHGWSQSSADFRPIARFLSEHGHDVRPIYLGDYKSMHDEITLQDFGYAMRQALEANNIPLERHSFNVVVHSTGGIVIREFLRQFCRNADGSPNPTLTPIKNALMLAPANFGSHLATTGKSMVGRLFRGWKWDGLFETGKHLLDALELGSPITYELGLNDLFAPDFPVFDPANTRATVMVGSADAANRMVRMNQENGSDGVVRVASASLNASHLKIDFADPAHPSIQWTPRNSPELALAVFDRSHDSIAKDLTSQRDDWRRIALRALSSEDINYTEHVTDCEQVTQATFEAGQNAHSIKKRKRFHEYAHIAMHVHDQYGKPIDDYFIEFYQEDGDDKDLVMEKVHGEILEKVKVNSIDPSYRSFLFDMTDLQKALEENNELAIDMCVVAANVSEDVTYRNPPDEASSGIRVFDQHTQNFFKANCPLLIDVTLYRDTGDNVFTIKPF